MFLVPFIAIDNDLVCDILLCEDKARMQRPSMDALPWMGQWVSLRDKRRLQKVQIQSVQLYQKNLLVGGFNPFEKY